MDSKIQDDFISTVSHELRTPLTSIRGFAQTMLGSWDKLDEKTKKKFLIIIEQQSNRLINLVENMLSVNKLNSFQGKFIFKSSGVNSLIEPIIAILKQQYPTHNIITEFSPKLPPVMVDVDKFQQVIINLLENACKYSPSASNVVVRTFVSNEFVSIKIIDEGIGIAQKDFETVFTKFARLDNPLTRQVQGSGLGLYITKILVEKMDGKILLQSDEKSTSFEILIPVSNLETQVGAACKKEF